jgi:hypothetical protein
MPGLGSIAPLPGVGEKGYQRLTPRPLKRLLANPSTDSRDGRFRLGGAGGDCSKLAAPRARARAHTWGAPNRCQHIIPTTPHQTNHPPPYQDQTADRHIWAWAASHAPARLAHMGCSKSMSTPSPTIPDHANHQSPSLDQHKPPCFGTNINRRISGPTSTPSWNQPPTTVPGPKPPTAVSRPTSTAVPGREPRSRASACLCRDGRRRL